MDNATKEQLKKFLDEDGKIIITDDMPEDLKSAINYMNENNLNLFEKKEVVWHDDDDDIDIEEDEDEDFDLSENDVSLEEIEESSDTTDTIDTLSDEADESSLQDLDNLF